MRIAIIAQLVFAAYLVGVNWYDAAKQMSTRGPDVPKPAQYGIWNIEA